MTRPPRGRGNFGNSNGRSNNPGHDNRFYQPPGGGQHRDFDQRRRNGPRAGRNNFKHHGGSDRFGQNQVYVASISSEGATGRFVNSNRNGSASRGMQHRGGHRGQARILDPNEKLWKKIVIRNGKDLGEKWISEQIAEHLEFSFRPIAFFTKGREAMFYVHIERSNVEAVKAISDRVSMPTGEKMKITVASVEQGPPIPNEFTPDMINVLQEVLSASYDSVNHVLNLSDFANKPGMIAHRLYLPLGKTKVADQVLKLILAHRPDVRGIDLSNNQIFTLSYFGSWVVGLPQVKSLNLSKNSIKHAKELERLSKWNIEEIHLNENEFVRSFKDESSYVSALRKIWPKLVNLNGARLPDPVTFDVDDEVSSLPPDAGSQFRNDGVKNLLTGFIQKYYRCFDSDDRSMLSEAYHEQALFSLAVGSYSTGRGRTANLFAYDDNRNLLRVTADEKRMLCLKSGSASITQYLQSMPKSRHILESFKFDVVHVIGQSMCVFAVTGVFEELDPEHRQPVYRQFGRMITALSQSDGRILIVNDQMGITNPSHATLQKARSGPAAFENSGPLVSPPAQPVTSAPVVQSAVVGQSTVADQTAMILEFSKQSGMHDEWSKQCLEAQAYDFEKAAQYFATLKGEGKIPPQAFK